jgi:hypothetical protein
VLINVDVKIVNVKIKDACYSGHLEHTRGINVSKGMEKAS